MTSRREQLPDQNNAVRHLYAHSDPLEGRVVVLPGDFHARVLSIEHEFSDGTTLRYVDGPYAGTLTMRDTYAVRQYPVASDEEQR